MRFRAGDSGKCRNSRPECRTTSFFSTDIFYPPPPCFACGGGDFLFSFISHREIFFQSLRTHLSAIANLFSVVVIFTFCQFVFVLLRMGGRIPEVAKRKSPGARRGALSGGLSFSYDRVNVVCCLTSVGGLFLFAFAGGFSLAFADGHLVAGHFLNESGVSCLDEDVVPLHKFADIGEVNAVAVPVGQGLVHDVL